MPRNKTKQKPPPLTKNREQFQRLQLALLARSMQPADFKFDPKTREDLRSLQVELLHRHLLRTISATDFALGNQAVGNLSRIMETTELQDEINELKQQAQIARRVLASKLGMEADHSTNREPLPTPTLRPRTVDKAEQDPQGSTV
jgi:hypothetical protein